MTSLNLYSETILSLAKTSRLSKRPQPPLAVACISNPLCGDRAEVGVQMSADGHIEDISFHIRGCVLCEASAMIMTLNGVGKTTNEIAAVIETFKTSILPEADARTFPWCDLDVFLPLRNHPSRHECVLLPFEALTQAIHSHEELPEHPLQGGVIKSNNQQS